MEKLLSLSLPLFLVGTSIKLMEIMQRTIGPSANNLLD